MIRLTTSTLDLIGLESARVWSTDVLGSAYALRLEDGTRIMYRLERGGSQLQGLLPSPSGDLNPPMRRCG